MPSPHVFHLGSEPPQDKSEGGERVVAYSGNFPILKGMSLYKLLLYQNSAREPHWHANADELGYCLKGQVLVTFYHTGDLKHTFLVQTGEAFFIPSGALHNIVNVGKEDAELLLQFSHEDPEEFALSSSIDMFSNAVLGNTWAVSQEFFNSLQRSSKNRFAVLTQAPESIPSEAHLSNPYHYALEASASIIDRSGGSARLARQNMWPILKCQSLYSLRINSKGMREPHWHPETAEMGYVHTGNGRMSILNPNGNIDTYLLQPGDLYYIPKAYPHHIENIGDALLHFLIFFDQAMPRDIGFTASVRAFSDEVLSSVLQVESSFIRGLNKYYSDLFIVDKINSTDPL
jgi:oxalate decarboxylase